MNTPLVVCERGQIWPPARERSRGFSNLGKTSMIGGVCYFQCLAQNTSQNTCHTLRTSIAICAIINIVYNLTIVLFHSYSPTIVGFIGIFGNGGSRLYGDHATARECSDQHPRAGKIIILYCIESRHKSKNIANPWSC